MPTREKSEWPPRPEEQFKSYDHLSLMHVSCHPVSIRENFIVVVGQKHGGSNTHAHTYKCLSNMRPIMQNNCFFLFLCVIDQRRRRHFAVDAFFWHNRPTECLPHALQVLFNIITEFQCVEGRRRRTVVIEKKVEVVVVQCFLEVTRSGGVEVRGWFRFQRSARSHAHRLQRFADAEAILSRHAEEHLLVLD